MNMIMRIEDEQFNVKLCNTKAAIQLYEQLPVTLSMAQLHGNEQYVFVNEQYTQQAKPYQQIQMGDFMLFGSSCLVLFYKTIATSFSYTPLGRILQPERLVSLCHHKHINIQLERGNL